MNKRERIAAKFEGRCAYCGEPLQRGWCADHVKPVHRNSNTGGFDAPENDTEDNLFPACRVCNYAKSNGDLEMFRANIAAQTDRARRDSWNFRMAEKYGLIRVTDNPVVFWFEQAVLQGGRE